MWRVHGLIIFYFIFNNISLMDYAYPYQVSFQDPATPVMEGIITLHHDLLYVLTTIGVAVGWVLFRTTFLFYHTKNRIPATFTHGTFIEVVWTITPSIILMAIAVPSFVLLYSMDEIIDPAVTLKVIGHQWYWAYEYSDYADKSGNAIFFDSYMIAENDLERGQLRLLEVDNRVVLPSNTHLRILITGADVIHSWAIPSLGIKMDACPGRLNQVSSFLTREGIFYGQCSEICGVNHGFMPIVVESVPVEKYINWVASQLESDHWLIDKSSAVQALVIRNTNL
jgi:cytochrome c oxidase subunit 2|uniref:Cytochrome c oxidase subunit 2 n=1 Tax=Baffinella frigidus TaxID=2571260 RepID=A0A6C0X9Y7_9CRYP|nr:cytochrome c oxidase subunit 2 [Cryptophyta sp. CCMP2293]